jgi:hypothetical protein
MHGHTLFRDMTVFAMMAQWQGDTLPRYPLPSGGVLALAANELAAYGRHAHVHTDRLLAGVSADGVGTSRGACWRTHACAGRHSAPMPHQYHTNHPSWWC